MHALAPIAHLTQRDPSLQCQRTDDAPDILDDETVEQFDIARSWVDRDMRRGRSVHIGRPVVFAERRSDPQAVRRQLGERERAPVGTAGMSIRQFDLLGGTAQPRSVAVGGALVKFYKSRAESSPVVTRIGSNPKRLECAPARSPAAFAFLLRRPPRRRSGSRRFRQGRDRASGLRQPIGGDVA